MICPNCGKETPENSKSCVNCGFIFNQQNADPGRTQVTGSGIGDDKEQPPRQPQNPMQSTPSDTDKTFVPTSGATPPKAEAGKAGIPPEKRAQNPDSPMVNPEQISLRRKRLSATLLPEDTRLSRNLAPEAWHRFTLRGKLPLTGMSR